MTPSESLFQPSALGLSLQHSQSIFSTLIPATTTLSSFPLRKSDSTDAEQCPDQYSRLNLEFVALQVSEPNFSENSSLDLTI